MPIPSDPFMPTFPANVPEASRWVPPQPDHCEAERRMSGNLPEQPDRVYAAPGNETPWKNLR